jgi:hypothetical protein
MVSFGLRRSSIGILTAIAVTGSAPAQVIRQGPELQVNTVTAGHQSVPSVAASANGDFVAAWRSLNQDGSSWGVFAQRFSSTGDRVGAESRVNTFTPDFQLAPSLVMTGMAT